MVGIHDDRIPASTGQPRRDKAEDSGARGRAGDYPELSVGRSGSARDRRGIEVVPPGARPAGDATLYRIRICAGREIESDDALLDYARRMGGTVFHPTSTCKMGVDAMAVVDPGLRVYGLSGLRVVDDR